MTTSCKYCGSTTVEWKQNLAGDWVLLAADGYRHRCPEQYAARHASASASANPERPAPKTKKKTGAFLRLYGPRTASTHALLVETKIDPDSPAAFVAELDAEKRAPWGTSFVQSQAARGRA